MKNTYFFNKKVFAFDLGKASIGYCVREDFDIKEVDSIIIDKNHAVINFAIGVVKNDFSVRHAGKPKEQC